MPPKKAYVSDEELNTVINGLESRLDQKFSSLSSKFDHIEGSVSDIKNDIIAIKDTVIQRLVAENTRLNKRVYDLECEFYKNQQYNRRNNIEISGIPDTVQDNELEDKVIEILEKIDVKVVNRDVEACHRLQKKIMVQRLQSLSS